MHMPLAGIQSLLLIATGVAAAGVGAALASRNIRTARRAFDRTAARSLSTLDGWDGWFLDGFSGVSTGLRWCSALASWLCWTLAGIGFITLGIHCISCL